MAPAPVPEPIRPENTRPLPPLETAAAMPRSEAPRAQDEARISPAAQNQFQLYTNAPTGAAGLFLNTAAFFGSPLANYMMLQQKPVIRPPDLSAISTTPPRSQSSLKTADETAPFKRNAAHVAIAFCIQRTKKSQLLLV